MQRETTKFLIRIDPKLHKKVKKYAKDNKTSMNHSMEAIIGEFFQQDTVEKMVSEMHAKICK